MPLKVFVGNLDFKTTRAEVQSLFQEAGEIRDVFLPMDRETGRPRGFAFVEFTTEEAAEKAISRFNGYQLAGRALRVNAAEDRPRGSSSYSRGSAPPPSFENYDDGQRFTPTKSKGSRRNLRARKRSL